MFGLVVSPRYIPNLTEKTALGPACLRSILYTVADVDRIAAVGVPYLVTVNNECAEVRPDWSGWEAALRAIAGRPIPPLAVCVGNEFDLYHQDNPADVPPEFAAHLVITASRILRPLGIMTVATSVAGRDWQSYLARMASLCWAETDWFDIHPYGQRPDGWGVPGWMHGDLRPTLSRACEIAQKPVICSEIGVKIADAGGEQQVALWLTAAATTIKKLGSQVCPVACYFAWKDQIGAPSEQGDQAFGLRAANGQPRLAWQAFADLSEDPVQPSHRHDVGAGLLTWMAEVGTHPIACSTFLPLGRNPAEIECAYANDGSEFRWSLVENRRLARLRPTV